jgi:hypothetical protein
MLKENLIGILFANMESEDKAKQNAEKMKNCPRLIASGTTFSTYYGVFILPPDKRWWLEYPVEHPEVLGAEKIQLHMIENPASPKEFELELPEEKGKITPCGSDCMQCPMHEQNSCDCCPATIYHK